MSYLARLIIFSILALSLAFQAQAQTKYECPENALQSSNFVINHFRVSEQIDQKVVNAALGLQQACKSQYTVNLSLADAWVSLSERPGISLDQRYKMASNAMDILLHLETLPSVPHNYRIAGETRNRIVFELVRIADAGGQKVSWLDGETPFPVCDLGFVNAGQKLWYQYKRDKLSTHTPVLLKAQVDACEEGETRNPFKYYAEYKVDLAEHTDDPALAFTYMRKARDLYDLYVGENDRDSGWPAEIRRVFNLKYIKAGLSGITPSEVMAKEDLFKAETLNTLDQQLALYGYIDQAWGPVPKGPDGKFDQDAYSAQIKLYVLAIHELSELAKAESLEAEWALYRAIEAHAEDGLRSTRTLEASTPPEFIRTIYDPENE